VTGKLLSVEAQLLRLVHGRFSHVAELQILESGGSEHFQSHPATLAVPG
jgi:hypothetical protein